MLASVIVVLAIGIGQSTALFSFTNSFFLRPLPLREPNRLVRAYDATRGPNVLDAISYPNYVDLRERRTRLADLAAHQDTTVSPSAAAAAGPARVELDPGSSRDAPSASRPR